MPKLTEINTYEDVRYCFSWDSLRELFDGDRERINLAHECMSASTSTGTGNSYSIYVVENKKRNIFGFGA
jgi:hypothetical protein